MSQITFKQNSTTRMTTAKTYDFLNRLTSINSSNSVLGTSSSFSYAYNNANQRTSATNVDGTYWVYLHDSLGQVVSGKKYWSDGTAVAGQQFEYGFDDIGNRLFAGSGGDQWGANLRYENYTANNLNQYAQRTAPAAVDMIGAANSNASVTVNNLSSSRQGEYFRAEITMANGAAAAYQTMTNVAVLNNGTNADIVTTNSGNVFLPKTPEAFTYDADGNATNDGRWMLAWNAESRLISAESQTTAPTASKRKVVLEYDVSGRLIRRTEYDGSSGSYVVTNDLKFVASGAQCLAELNATNNAVVRTYLWGLDLNGTVGGAGGVGGLLAINSAANLAHFHAMDGNGNVAALISTSGGTSSATYEYGPFGQPIRANGLLASENPFRFSTKRTDTATDFTLYEYRPYRPLTGCWLSRDRIEEGGGPNLYGFSGNDPISRYDALGLAGEDYYWDPTWRFEPIGAAQTAGMKLWNQIRTQIATEKSRIQGSTLTQITGYTGMINFFTSMEYSLHYRVGATSRHGEAGLFVNGLLTLPTSDRNTIQTIVHEMMHGYVWYFGAVNRAPLGLSNRQDEGVAYAFEKFMPISMQLITIERLVKRKTTSDCDSLRGSLQALWRSLWKEWGHFLPASEISEATGNPGWSFGYYYTYWGLSAPFALDATDISRLAGYPFNVQLRCSDQASWINLWLAQKPCCLQVTCDQTSPDQIHVVPAGSKIDPVFK